MPFTEFQALSDERDSLYRKYLVGLASHDDVLRIVAITTILNSIRSVQNV